MPLFLGFDGPDQRRGKLEQIRIDIDKLAPEDAMTVDDNDLVERMLYHYAVAVPELLRDQVSFDQTTANFRVGDPKDFETAEGILLKFDVPFTGDKNIFFTKPGPSDGAPPNANVLDQKLWFELGGPGATVQSLQADFETRISAIEQYLSWHRDLWSDFDQQIEKATRDALTIRRKIINDARTTAVGLEKQLGIRLNRRGDDPQSFTPPPVRKRAEPVVRNNLSAVVDPKLADDVYRDIVKIIHDVGRSIERSASAIRDHEEEVLRDILLIPLNSHYENSARGEAFNKAGKTDILIPHVGGNLFVGECKIWRGDSDYLAAFDQLLSYLTWRDTKSALVIFSRNVGFTSVQKKLTELPSTHKGFVSGPRKFAESGWDFTFRHPDDEDRRLNVAVLAFDLGRQ